MSWSWKRGEVLSRSRSFCKGLSGVMGLMREEPRGEAPSSHLPDVESRGGRLRRTRARIDDLGIRRASWTWDGCVAARHLSSHPDFSRPPKVLMTAVPTIPNLTSTWKTNTKLVANALELVHWSPIAISTNTRKADEDIYFTVEWFRDRATTWLHGGPCTLVFLDFTCIP